MYKSFVALIACLLSVYSSLGQKNITIHGHLSGIDDDVVTVFPAFDGFMNSQYGFPCPVKDHRFTFKYSSVYAGFVEIESPSISRCVVYVQPGEEVSLSVKGINGGLWFAVNGGHDPKGNTLLLAFKLGLVDRRKVGLTLNPKLAEQTESETAFNFVKRYIDSVKGVMDSLHKARLLTESFYQALSAFQESVVINSCCDYLNNARELAQGDTLAFPVHLRTSACNQLLWHLLTTYDPFDDKYRGAMAEETNLLLKGELIRSHILPDQSAGKRIYWIPEQRGFAKTLDTFRRPFIDSTFWMLEPDLKEYPFAYVSGFGQELLQSQILSSDFIQGKEEVEVMRQMIAIYAKKYPHSEILPFLTRDFGRYPF